MSETPVEASNSNRDEPKPTEEITSAPTPTTEAVAIRKTWSIVGVVGLVAFLVGMGVGYIIHSHTFNRGSAQARTAPSAEKIDVSVDDEPAIGPKDAPVAIIEFSDFQCPFCADFYAKTYRPLLQKYDGKIRLVFRDFPLRNVHPDAEKAAEAGNCAFQQGPDKFWALHDAMFAYQRTTGINIGVVVTMAKYNPWS